jgi:hypothetical protein
MEDFASDQGPARLGLSAPTQAALKTLFEARAYAELAGVDVWEFAVEIRSLAALGVSSNDLRWLVCQGYAAHAKEATQPGSRRREFQTITSFMMPEEACFVLTDDGVALLTRLGGSWPLQSQPSRIGPSLPSSNVLPNWDIQARELRLGPLLIKRFKQPAAKQETILTAFQEEGWPFRIDDPLPPHLERDSKRQLHDTINNLNRRQLNSLIRFLGDGKGEGICWKIRPLGYTRATPELHQNNQENVL